MWCIEGDIFLYVQQCNVYWKWHFSVCRTWNISKSGYIPLYIKCDVYGMWCTLNLMYIECDIFLYVQQWNVYSMWCKLNVKSPLTFLKKDLSLQSNLCQMSLLWNVYGIYRNVLDRECLFFRSLWVGLWIYRNRGGLLEWKCGHYLRNLRNSVEDVWGFFK